MRKICGYRCREFCQCFTGSWTGRKLDNSMERIVSIGLDKDSFDATLRPRIVWSRPMFG